MRVPVVRNILEVNDRIANEHRELFKKNNLVSDCSLEKSICQGIGERIATALPTKCNNVMWNSKSNKME